MEKKFCSLFFSLFIHVSFIFGSDLLDRSHAESNRSKRSLFVSLFIHVSLTFGSDLLDRSHSKSKQKFFFSFFFVFFEFNWSYLAQTLSTIAIDHEKLNAMGDFFLKCRKKNFIDKTDLTDLVNLVQISEKKTFFSLFSN